jgi:uncharacterized membrane protein
MTKNRTEAFSDGVFAIILTIMVLELKAPLTGELYGLAPLWAEFVSYIVSFAYVGIYWNNHHHMMQACDKVDGRTLWANQHLLFWLSLVPFVTSWVGKTDFAAWPVAAYGFVLFMAGVAYRLLAMSLVHLHGPDSLLGIALGRDVKGKLSLVLYAAALPLAFVEPWISCAIYGAVAVMWIVPDPRISATIEKCEAAHEGGESAADEEGGPH